MANLGIIIQINSNSSYILNLLMAFMILWENYAYSKKIEAKNINWNLIKAQQMAHVLPGNMSDVASNQGHGGYCRASVKLWACIWFRLTRTVMPRTLTSLSHLIVLNVNIYLLQEYFTVWQIDAVRLSTFQFQRCFFDFWQYGSVY